MTIEHKLNKLEAIFDSCFYDIDKKLFFTISRIVQDTNARLHKRMAIMYCIRILLYLHNIYVEGNLESDSFKNIALKRKFYIAKESFLCNINLILDDKEL